MKIIKVKNQLGVLFQIVSSFLASKYLILTFTLIEQKPMVDISWDNT